MSAEPILNPSPFVELVIRYDPQSHQFAVGWPNVDDIIKLGMLEFAKTTLVEARAKAGMGPQSNLVMPVHGRLQ